MTVDVRLGSMGFGFHDAAKVGISGTRCHRVSRDCSILREIEPFVPRGVVCCYGNHLDPKETYVAVQTAENLGLNIRL